MNVKIGYGLKGAQEATGVAVIIDVFRAFTCEAVMMKRAKTVYPCGTIEESLELKKQLPEALLVGERGGKILEGFDFGNSPSHLAASDLSGRILIHNTSAGTQGLILAKDAKRIFTGALINAKATAQVIQQLNPEEVTLVAMGWMGTDKTDEDELCAQYLKSLLLNKPMQDIKERALALKETEGKKFFDPLQQDKFPMADFEWCTDVDAYDFALEVVKKDGHCMVERRDVR